MTGGKEPAPAPKAWIATADVCNVLAGVSLVISLTVIMLGSPFDAISLAEEPWASLQKYTMISEGVFYAIAGLCLTVVNIKTNFAAGACSQTIIMFGGMFFTVSAWGLPSKIISLQYVIPMVSDVTFPDVCAHYGITCFMAGTAIGISGVLGLPKNSLVSVFWGVAFFFVGAWTIGLCNWVPVLAGGGATYLASGATDPPTPPAVQWTFLACFRVMGSLFLLMGAIVFALLDSRPPPSEQPLIALDESVA